MKPKHVVVALLIAAWLAGGAWATRYVAGGVFLAMYRADPRTVQAETWSTYWAGYQDNKKVKKQLQGSMGIAVFALFGLPILVYLANRKSGRSLHGDARWARFDEVKEAGLFAEDGIILGKLGGKFLMMNLAKFVMLIAPTRSGKGVGIIIPNLLNWAHSVIVVDIKGENFKVTSGFRAKHGQQVFCFAPFGVEREKGIVFETHRWNPLSYVSRDPRFVVGQLQSLGYMLYPRKDTGDSFWNDQARNLFVGLALYCMECGHPVTLGEILRRSNGGGKPKEFWQEVVEKGHDANGVMLSEDCLNSLRQFVGNSDNTLTSILSSFNAPLGVFNNPAVDAATSDDDFDLRDVRRKKMSIYVVVPPNRLDEAGLLVNLFFSVAIDENTKVLPENDPSLKHLCLLMLDEFPALGRVAKFEKAVGYIAGYGLRAITIAQSQSQLQGRELYGEEGCRTLVANHMISVMFAPREQKDAQEYSEILGYMTEKGVSTGVSRGNGKPTRSENQSDQKRALMLPQELRELGPDRSIVLSDDCKPVLADKIRYYTDPAFATRLLPAAPVPSIDVDAHIARREGRVRELKTDEPVNVERLAIDTSSMPQVSGKGAVQEEVAAMADWLFSKIKWTESGAESASHQPNMEASPA